MVFFFVISKMAEQTLKKSKAVGRVSNGLDQTVDNKFVQSKDLNFHT